MSVIAPRHAPLVGLVLGAFTGALIGIAYRLDQLVQRHNMYVRDVPSHRLDDLRRRIEELERRRP